MKNLILLIVSIFSFSCASQSTYELVYPEAKRTDQSTAYHGVDIPDPYLWMEELNNPELNQWMSKQEGLYKSYIREDDPLIEVLKSEMSERFEKDMISAPIQRGDKIFVPVTAAGASSQRHYLIENNNRKLLIDLEALKTDKRTYSNNNYSPKGKYIAFNESINKSRYNNVLFYDVDNDEILSDTIRGFYGGRSFMAWDQLEKGFFYSKYDVPEDPQAQLSQPQFMYHTMGTSQDDDVLVFETSENPSWIFRGSVTFDDQYLIIQITDPAAIGNMILVKDLKDPSSAFVKLVDNFDYLFSFLYKEGDRLFFETTLNAPNHRVVAIDINELGTDKWQEIIPESDQVISAVFVVGNRLALRSNVITRKVLNVYDFNGIFKFKLDPEGSAIFLSPTDRSSKKAYMTVASILSPNSVYEVDLESGNTSLYSQVKLSVSPEDFTFEHASFTSTDGTEVPIQLVYKKGLKKDGTAPVFLYGYGAFNWSAYPWQNYLVPWIKRGGIYVIPNIRGGGVNGEGWYESGTRSKKRNTIDDYIKAAEWLVEQGYSSKGRIVANGGSASGLLPAIAINERPDLYGACIIDYPVLDMLRYHKFGSANWTSDFGSSDNQADFELLRSYSPYHNIDPTMCYPPTLVQVGELDNTTTPMHGYKYAAAMQHAVSQSCNNPVLLKISRGAGHSAGATRQDRIQTQAEQLAFLSRVLKLNYK